MTKFCGICKLKIETNKEYSEFIHWEKEGKKKSRSYYHIECFRKRMMDSSKNEELQNKAMRLLMKVEDMVN